MSTSWEVLIWTLHQETCCVHNGQIVALSDRRVAYFDAGEVISLGYVDELGQPTSKFPSVDCVWLLDSQVRSLMRVFERSDRWKFVGNHAVSDHTLSRILRHRIVSLIQRGILQIDADGWITRCTTSPVTLIKRPATA